MSDGKFLNIYRTTTWRAQWHDYSGGAYFVTINTHNHYHYFGEIKDGEMRLTEIGKVAEQCLRDISAHFPHVDVPLYVVMPNHIHAIIIVDSVKAQNFAPLQDATIPNKYGPQSRNLASVVRGFKIGVKKYATINHIPFAWQPRFYDHIIRDTNEMNSIADYIENNVAQWEYDKKNL